MVEDPNIKTLQKQLVEGRKKEQQKAIDEYKAQLAKDRAARQAAELDEMLKNASFIDPQSGRTLTYWEDAQKKADSAMSSEVNSYNDWRAAMMCLLSMFGALNKAISSSLRIRIYSPATDLALDWIAYPIIDKNFNSKLKLKEVTLPTLKHLVEYTDDNKLKVNKLIRSDLNTEFSPNFNGAAGTLDAVFKRGIEAWLNENGYQKHPDDARAQQQNQVVENPRFVNANGTLLDKTTFNTLKADRDHGLDNFLSRNPDLSFTPSPSPASPAA